MKVYKISPKSQNIEYFKDAHIMREYIGWFHDKGSLSLEKWA